MKVIALHADSIGAGIGNHLVFNNFSASFTLGRLSCIVGPNGAGKSTLLKVLAGLLPVQHGAVSVFGQPLAGLTARQRAQQMAWLGQDEAGGLEQRCIDIVLLGRLPQLGWLTAPTPADWQACHEALRQTDALPWAERRLGELSAGQQQRVRLARALATQAKLLLLDEPLANLDPPHQIELMSLLRTLAAQGMTVVCVLHELPLALLADELVILQEGRLLHQGSSADPATHRALEAVFDHCIKVCQVQGQWTALPKL